jgi:hypothetical protein
MKFLKNTDRRVMFAGLIVAGVFVIAGAWYLGSPLFINNRVDEAFPAAQPAMPDANAMVKTDAPAALSQGSFTVVDSIHKGAGNAVIYQLPDGKRVLRFENFNVTNGPDLFVYLAGSAMPRSSGDLHSASLFEVARLKGNMGDQNYELPADLDLEQFKSVVIYCKQFSVVFSTADLMQAG